MKRSILCPFAAIALLFFGLGNLPAQETPGDLPTPPSDNPDTTIVFSSPRPLVEFSSSEDISKTHWGMDLLFSGSGFGFGAYYGVDFSENVSGLINLGMSGSQNTDEFEQFQPEYGRWLVPNKINRLFMFPITAGMQYRLFTEELTASFRPYIQGGLGPTIIMQAPYRENANVNGDFVEFFSSLGRSEFHVRPGMYAGIGAYVGESPTSVTMVNIRYFFIPFGGEGLESIQGLPIENFGGLFLSLSVGIR